MLEQFAIISEYPTYAISTFGYVININTGRILKLRPNKKSYNCVILYKNNKTKSILIHELMSNTF